MKLVWKGAQPSALPTLSSPRKSKANLQRRDQRNRVACAVGESLLQQSTKKIDMVRPDVCAHVAVWMIFSCVARLSGDIRRRLLRGPLQFMHSIEHRANKTLQCAVQKVWDRLHHRTPFLRNEVTGEFVNDHLPSKRRRRHHQQRGGVLRTVAEQRQTIQHSHASKPRPCSRKIATLLTWASEVELTWSDSARGSGAPGSEG